MQDYQFDYLDQRYRTLAPLGTREKQSTWLAQDDVTGQIVVKKYISAENAEVYETLKKMSHKNLVRIFHIAKKEISALVIMEYVSGKTIQSYKDENYLFSETETKNYIIQLLEGLESIHSQRMIHRDINPKNLLISTDGILKILDFDIGRRYKANQGQDTEILGTADYAAPEQFGFMQSDKRTDLYAVGVLINTMLTGVMPREHIYAKGKFGYIIRKCIQMDPEKRYQSASEILMEFRDRKQSPEKSIWPGFRSGVPWKQKVAAAYYILMVIYTIGSVIECSKTFPAALLEIIAIFTYVWLAVFLAFDFCHWMEKVPVIRQFGRKEKLVFGIFLWVFLFCIGYNLEQYVRIDLLHLAVRTKK